MREPRNPWFSGTLKGSPQHFRTETQDFFRILPLPAPNPISPRAPHSPPNRRPRTRSPPAARPPLLEPRGRSGGRGQGPEGAHWRGRGASGARAGAAPRGGAAIRAGRWRPQFACSPAELREARPAPGPPFRPPPPPGPRPPALRPPAPPSGRRSRVVAARRHAADSRLGRRRRGRAPPGLRIPAASSSIYLNALLASPEEAVPPAGSPARRPPALSSPALPPALPGARPTAPLLAASRAARRRHRHRHPPRARACDGRGLRRPNPSWAPAARAILHSAPLSTFPGPRRCALPSLLCAPPTPL